MFLKVEQYRNNRANYLHSETSEDILDLTEAMQSAVLMWSQIFLTGEVICLELSGKRKRQRLLF